MPQPSDVRLAAALVVKGFASQQAMEDCLRWLDKAASAGKLVSLERLVASRGIVPDAVLQSVRRGEGLLHRGEKIGDYELLAKIGEGGMSYVFKTRKGGAPPDLALKLLKPHLCDDATTVGRFKREAKLLARLSHANIPKAVDIGLSDGAPFYVMEFVDGATLLEIVQQNGPFGEDAALYVIMQIADALDYLFSVGLVHRDVKPGNILLKRDNTVKLIDLGLATQKGAGGSDKLSETTVGTVHYISPEQAAGQADVDVRSDIYSLGVTLYHIVVGELPFSGADDSDVMRRQILESLSTSTLQGKNVSPHMHYFLEKMMAKERDVRYQSPRELVEDIREHIRGKKTLTFNPRFSGTNGEVEVEKPYSDAAPEKARRPSAGVPDKSKPESKGTISSFFRFLRDKTGK